MIVKKGEGDEKEEQAHHECRGGAAPGTYRALNVPPDVPWDPDEAEIQRLLTIWEDTTMSIDQKLVATFRGLSGCLGDSLGPLPVQPRRRRPIHQRHEGDC